MATVATSAPNPGSPVPETAITLLSSADMLRSKVGTVLAIMGQCTPLILDTSGDFGSDKLKAQYDGGCADSAQVTYIGACARLDALLHDDGNWKIRELDDVMTERTAALHDISLKLAQLNFARAEYFNRPSILAGAKLFRIESTFYAVLGDGGVSADSIQGKGGSVEEALANLDAILLSVPGSKPAVKPRKKP